jgi:FAD/FMN-containing dehydrogenase
VTSSYFLEQIENVIGPDNLITDKERARPYTEEWHARYHSDCLAVCFPGNTRDVAHVVKLCYQQQVGIVPQGGNTGTVGGAIAQEDQLIVNLGRMNTIEVIDTMNNTMTIQAGCILSHIQECAVGHDRLFPLSIGAQGSCQIGGNLATNAGGINVLHYGNTRDLVLGIEVVLADGRVLNSMSELRKDNAGYDIRNLFIGSEGSLGIITRAVLKLFPLPSEQITSLIGVKNIEAALSLLHRLKSDCGDRVTTLEIMSRVAVDTASENISAISNPLGIPCPWYILAIVSSASISDDNSDLLSCTLEKLQSSGIVVDTVVAANETQARQLVALREAIVEAQKFLGGSIKHDVSVPVSRLAEFVETAGLAVLEIIPDAILYTFGHLGDGNMHFNIAQPASMGKEEFLGYYHDVNRAVFDIVFRLQGSISAEHGIGMAKTAELVRYGNEVELEIYRSIKNALDPSGIMNPGKVLENSNKE